jgi:hypothetical protein
MAMRGSLMMFDFIKRWALRTTASRRPDVFIGGEINTYMRRWFAIPRNPIFNVYLHEFVRSDDDRALHDHPWWNMSLLLDGEYTEHTIAAGGVESRVVYHAGQMKFRHARFAHRIELHAGPCKTLFLTGPRLRVWGFHCPKGWRDFKEFTKPGATNEVGKGPPMSDITSFNALFAEAARRGLRLNSFHQDKAGVWRANWRTDEPKLWHGPVCEAATPFETALNAFVMADLQAPAHGSVAFNEDIATGPTVSDLFG